MNEAAISAFFCTFAQKFRKMRKSLTLLTLLLCLTAITSQAKKRKQAPAVNWPAVRSQLVSDVSYDLTFYIPSTHTEKLTGMAVVTFALRDKADMALDFGGQFTGATVVNDKKRKLRFENGHLLIPKKYTEAGANRVVVSFESTDGALHRSDGLLTTKFSEGRPSSCFPCFDQPDIPAKFVTHLNLPDGWKAMSSESQRPISLQLYSFLAGRFDEKIVALSGHTVRALYRQSDIADASQLPKILEESAHSLRWMEGFTGVAYPFNECGLLLLTGPASQDINNPGIIRLTDSRVFTPKKPTREESLKQSELIAYETARLWFGNMVTPREAKDAWGIDLLAAYMAHKMAYQSKRARTEYEMEFLTTTLARAKSAEGTDADRGAVMMRYLEGIAGEKLQPTLQQFLLKYFYKPASWNDFISMLEKQLPGENVSQFNDTWVKQSGLPTIHTSYQDGYLVISQTPPAGTPAFWPQQFDVRLIYDFEKSRTIDVNMSQPVTRIKLKNQPSCIIPNFSGRGYGHFTLDDNYTKQLPLRIMVTRDDLNRYALLETTFDNYKMGRVPASYFGELYRDMLSEKTPSVMQLAVDHMMEIATDRKVLSERQTLEQCIMDLLPENRRPECRQTIIRKMAASASAPQVVNQLYDIWQSHSDPLFAESDYTEMAYRLALMRPLETKDILSRQRERLQTDAEREEFDFVSRACASDAKSRQDLINNLRKPQSKPKAWVDHSLRLLNVK